MLKIDIIAAGRMRGSLFENAAREYQKRILWPLQIIEIEGRDQAEEETKFLKYIKNNNCLILLDERGKDTKSTEFAGQIQKLQDNSETNLQFIIGGADGHTDALRSKARIIIGFGLKTWPHLLARLMLLEQIYRAQQILSNHPYHRE